MTFHCIAFPPFLSRYVVSLQCFLTYLTLPAVLTCWLQLTLPHHITFTHSSHFPQVCRYVSSLQCFVLVSKRSLPVCGRDGGDIYSFLLTGFLVCFSGLGRSSLVRNSSPMHISRPSYRISTPRGDMVNRCGGQPSTNSIWAFGGTRGSRVLANDADAPQFKRRRVRCQIRRRQKRVRELCHTIIGPDQTDQLSQRFSGLLPDSIRKEPMRVLSETGLLISQRCGQSRGKLAHYGKARGLR